MSECEEHRDYDVYCRTMQGIYDHADRHGGHMPKVFLVSMGDYERLTRYMWSVIGAGKNYAAAIDRENLLVAGVAVCPKEL